MSCVSGKVFELAWTVGTACRVSGESVRVGQDRRDSLSSLSEKSLSGPGLQGQPIVLSGKVIE